VTSLVELAAHHLQEFANDAIIVDVLQTRPVPDVTAQTRLFRALADPARLAILETLRAGELTAGEVANAVHLTPSTASRHLACLRSCGLVESRQQWRHVHYRIASTSTSSLLEAADRVLDDVAAAMAACALPEMQTLGGADR
jgi:ArsR family transcriptional regulator, cadmium/lead-responsive transcriptional repressor